MTLEHEYVSHMDHLEIDPHSLLILVTNSGHIRGIDLRTMKQVWNLIHPPHYGAITAILSNKRGHWLLTGTNRGVLCLWDMRFKIVLKAWRHPNQSRIHKLSSFIMDGQSATPLKLVSIATSQEVSVWDISSTECTQLWISLNPSESLSDPQDILQRIYGEQGLKVCHLYNLYNLNSIFSHYHYQILLNL